MDNADKFADKFADKWNFQKAKCPQPFSNAGGSVGARTPDHLIKRKITLHLNQLVRGFILFVTVML